MDCLFPDFNPLPSTNTIMYIYIYNMPSDFFLIITKTYKKKPPYKQSVLK